METYVCAHCGRRFEKTWSDDEAMAECRSNFSDLEIKSGGLAIVCDDCYRAFKEWMRVHPERREN